MCCRWATEYKVFFGPLLVPGKNVQPKNLQPTQLRQTTIRRESEPKTSSTTIGANGEPVLKRGTTFQSEFSTDTSSSGVATTLLSDTRRAKRNSSSVDTELELNPFIKDSTYLKLKAQPYRLSFKPDFVQARIDNTVLYSIPERQVCGAISTPARPSVGLSASR